MAYYLVRGKPFNEKVDELKDKVRHRSFIDLQPFGRAISYSLENARIDADGWWIWEEEDYCSPPLSQERAAVIDTYFKEILVEEVQKGEGWRRIKNNQRAF
jgi:hypothetical protein